MFWAVLWLLPLRVLVVMDALVLQGVLVLQDVLVLKIMGAFLWALIFGDLVVRKRGLNPRPS